MIKGHLNNGLYPANVSNSLGVGNKGKAVNRIDLHPIFAAYQLFL